MVDVWVGAELMVGLVHEHLWLLYGSKKCEIKKKLALQVLTVNLKNKAASYFSSRKGFILE